MDTMIFASPTQTARLGALPGVDAILLGPLVPTSLLWFVQPTSATVNVAFSPQPIIKVLDQYGDVLTSYTQSVNLAVESGSGALTGGTNVACVAGVANFGSSNVACNTANSALVMRAEIMEGISALADPIAVTP